MSKSFDSLDSYRMRQLIINVISPSTLYRKKRNPKTKTDEDSIAETEANCFGDLGMHAESALRAIVDSRWGLKGERERWTKLKLDPKQVEYPKNVRLAHKVRVFFCTE